MDFSGIQPFLRYIHFITIDENSKYLKTVPYDNRLFYMYKGTSEIITDNDTYTLAEGDVVIIPAGINYRLAYNDSHGVYIAVNFDYTRRNSDKTRPIPPDEVLFYDKNKQLEHIEFSDIPSFNTAVYIKDMKNISVGLLQLEHEYINKLLYFEQIASCVLSEILLECARQLNNTKCVGNSEIINLIIGYINENYSLPLSNASVGQIFNLHPNYISYLIKSFTGMPLHRYLIRTRVSHSIEYLNSKNYSVSEIAEKCGFCDIYHYSKTFKKIMGVSPAQYINYEK